MSTPRRFAAVIISGLIAASALAVATPASATVTPCSTYFATRGGGDGTLTNPYLVSSQADLNKVRDCLGASFRQDRDIDLSGTWSPIGDNYYLSAPFTGTFDGGGFMISDLMIPLSADPFLQPHVGLFGFAVGATLTGINISGGSVEGIQYVGGLVGQATETSITNSSSSADVTGVDEVGGLIGSIGTNPDALAHGVCNSFSSGNVTGRDDPDPPAPPVPPTYELQRLGGLAGSVFQMIISDVHASGDVTDSPTFTGGRYMGGLFGEAFGSALSRAYASGSVDASATAGGIVGNGGGNVTSGVTWDRDTTRQVQSRILDDTTSNTTTNMKKLTTFELPPLDWSIGPSGDPNTTWWIDQPDGTGYPYLASFGRPGVVAPNACTPATPSAPTASAGDGSATITANQGVGGTRPTSLLIAASPGSGTCTISAASGSCAITGLTNGTSYTFTATATNTVGTSTASAASAAVTPRASGGGSTPSPTPTPTPSPAPPLIDSPVAPSPTVPAAPTFGIQLRPLAPGISAVTGEITTVTVPIRSAKPAGTSPSNAPRVSASLGQVIRVSIDGLASSQRVTTALQVESRWIRLGTSRTGAKGRTTLPAFVTSVPGSYLMRIMGPETGTRYVWVDVR